MKTFANISIGSLACLTFVIALAGAAPPRVDSNVQDSKEHDVHLAGDDSGLPNLAGPSGPWQLNGSDIYYNDGNVGIGTSTPKGQIHNTGDYYGVGDIWLHALEGDGLSGTAFLQSRDDSGISNIALRIRTQNSGSLVNAMHIAADGDVGIGTTTPGALLDVGGDVHVAGDLVSDTGWFGTTDDTPVELYVNDVRAMRFEYAEVDSTPAPNFIGGHLGNTITSGGGAVIAGGGGDAAVNQVAGGDWATISGGKANMVLGGRGVVSGGESNMASGDWSNVAGGQSNSVTGDYANVGGGLSNSASGNRGTVAGGKSNTASGAHSTVAGGELNTASGNHSMVLGGFTNLASGDYSFAAGRRAKATHIGAFVWADSKPADISSTGVDQFLVRARGGATLSEGDLRVDRGTNSNGFTADLTLAGARNGGSNEFASINFSNFDDNVDTPADTVKAWIRSSNATSDDAGDLRFATSTDGDDPLERMRIEPGGNVGVGTASPNNQLTVAGTADISGKLGIGRSNPSGKLHVEGSTDRIAVFQTSDSFTRIDIEVADGNRFIHGGPLGLNWGIDLIGYMSLMADDSFRPTLYLGTGAAANADENASLHIVRAGQHAIHLNNIDDPNDTTNGGSRQGQIRMTSDGFLEMRNTTNATWASLSSNGIWGTSSDRNLKYDIDPLRGLLDTARALNPVSFFYNNQKNDPAAEKQIGMIAQEVEPLLPSLVNGSEGSMTMNYSGLSVVAIGAIQELATKVDALERALDASPARIDAGDRFLARTVASQQAEIQMLHGRLADQQAQIDRQQDRLNEISAALDKLTATDELAGN